MTKHSKGPWYYAASELDPRKHSFAITADSGTGLIADIYKKRHWDGKKNTEAPEVSEANARLIAAAPELLEALTECLSVIKLQISGATTDKAKAMAAMAIKKATDAGH